MRSLLVGILSAPLIVHATTVYLHPPVDGTSHAPGASALISHHLRLERFEPIGDSQLPVFSEPFVGEGDSVGLVLSVEEPYAKGALQCGCPNAPMF